MNQTQAPHLRVKPDRIWSHNAVQRVAYADERAAAVMQALREGKTQKQILGDGPKRSRIASIWTAWGIERYRTEHPEWAAEFDTLAERNRKAADAKKGDGQKARTRCAQGHPFTSENTRMERRNLNGRTFFSRSCIACHRAVQERQTFKAEEIETIKIAVLQDGETLAQTRERLGLSTSKMSNLMKTDLGKILLPASKANLAARFIANRPPKIIRQRAIKPAPIILAPYIAPRFRNDGNLIALVGAHVGRHLPRDMQDDIIGEVIVQLLAGEIAEADIPSAVHRARSASFNQDHNRFGPISLDIPAYRDGATPLVETISQGLWSP